MLLLDTNVLVYAHDSSSKRNRKALRLVREALRGELEAAISYQSIMELYSVLTNPTKLERPYGAREAALLCSLYAGSKNLVKLLPSGRAYLESINLAGDLGLVGMQIFDCLLATTAKENGIKEIYTENVADFRSFEFIKAFNPFIS